MPGRRVLLANAPDWPALAGAVAVVQDSRGQVVSVPRPDGSVYMQHTALATSGKLAGAGLPPIQFTIPKQHGRNERNPAV